MLTIMILLSSSFFNHVVEICFVAVISVRAHEVPADGPSCPVQKRGASHDLSIDVMNAEANRG